MAFLKTFACFGSKPRSASTHPVSGNELAAAQHVCDGCGQKFSTKPAIQKHQLICHEKKANKGSPADISSRLDTSSNLRDGKPDNVKGINASRNPSLSTNANTDKSISDPSKTVSPDRALQDTFLSDKNANSSMISDRMRATNTSSFGNPLFEEVERFAEEMAKKAPKARREQELNFITKNLDKKTDAKFLVSETWIENYTNYLNGSIKTPPEPIDNEKLKQMVITKTLPTNIYLINEIVWIFIQRLYGGGPEIKQQNKSITFRRTGFSDQSSDAITADTFSRTDVLESSRNSFLDTAKNPWTGSHLQPVGLANPSFYCYMNACLQLLFSIPDFAQYLYGEKYKLIINKPNAQFWKAMTEVVHGHFKRQSCIIPRTLRKLSTKQFDPELQHDAHEWLRFILSYMQDEVNLPIPKKENDFKNAENAWSFYKKYHISLVDDMLAGQLISSVTCTKCKAVSSTYDPYLDLSLPIIPDKTRDLTDCLATFQHEEEIEGGYKCEKCKNNVKAVKSLSIARCPNFLVITLKRFEHFPKKKKLKDDIRYPMQNLKIKESATKEMATFNLIGVIVHIGPIDSGHYISYSKRGNQWILCDDENITKVDEAEVASKEAYVLLYERAANFGTPKM